MTDESVPISPGQGNEFKALSPQDLAGLERIGFIFGVQEFWPQGIEFTPPSEEEQVLVQRHTGSGISAFEKSKISDDELRRLMELRQERARACGYTGLLVAIGQDSENQIFPDCVNE